MLYRIETNAGSVSLTKGVIGKIVVESVKKFDGRVLVSNAKGKTARPSRRDSEADDANLIEASMGPKGLDVRVFIVIRFGTSISLVTNRLIEDIGEQITVCTGLVPNSIAVVVTGMMTSTTTKPSKQQTSRRNIEVKR